MSSDSYTPRTTETRLTLPLNGTIYTTRRKVAPEKPAPSIGATMQAELGAAWSSSIIIAANLAPDGTGDTLQIVHATIPALADQLEDNWRATTITIGGVEIPAIERFFIFRASDYDSASPARGSAMPYKEGDPFDPSGAAYKLVDRETVTSGVDLEPVFKVERRVYVNVGDTDSQLPDNWRYSSASIGGQAFPAVTRTFLRLAADVLTDGETTPAAGSAMPVSTSATAHDRLFDGKGYVLAQRDITRAPDDLHPLFCLDTRQYVRKSARDSYGIDPLNGLALYRTSVLYHKAEVVTGSITAAALFDDPDNAFWGVQDNATQRSGRQISEDWYEVVTESLVGGQDGSGSGEITVATYETTTNYYWPPVLASFVLKQWERRDGSYEVYPSFKFDPESYRGPCRMRVTQKWKKTEMAVRTPTVMLPTPVNYGSPGYRLNIPPCLHGTIAPKCDYGTGHPVYGPNFGSQEIFPATEPTEWPSHIDAPDEQRPFRGGFLKTELRIYPPGT